MTELYNEIRERFPEVCSRFSEGDEELSYELMRHLAEWLQELPAVSSSVTKRVVAFSRWCEQRPRGADAGDDLMTILVVGFYEKLFDSASTRRLLPKLIPLETLEANAEYLTAWVGAENYHAARQQYPPRRRAK